MANTFAHELAHVIQGGAQVARCSTFFVNSFHMFSRGDDCITLNNIKQQSTAIVENNDFCGAKKPGFGSSSGVMMEGGATWLEGPGVVWLLQPFSEGGIVGQIEWW